MLDILIHWGMSPEIAKSAMQEISFWLGLGFGTTCGACFWRMLAII